MRRRKLSDSERALWDSVARQAEPLFPTRRAPIGTGKPASKPAVAATAPKTLGPFNIGQSIKPGPTALSLNAPIEEQLSARDLRMDAKKHRAMRQGKLVPEARIDLHGMTRDAAHGVLIRFITSAHLRGLRLVLVISGKGKDRDDGGPIPERFGVLRHAVPHWLSAPPLSAFVLQVTQAHRRHGGGGAYYVYLKKRAG